MSFLFSVEGVVRQKMQNSDVQLQHHATTTLGPSQAVKYSAAVTSNAMTCTCSGSSVKPEARQAWWGLLS